MNYQLSAPKMGSFEKVALGPGYRLQQTAYGAPLQLQAPILFGRGGMKRIIKSFWSTPEGRALTSTLACVMCQKSLLS